MKYRAPVFASALLAACLACSPPAQAAQPSADATALQQLARSGKDLSQPQRLEFLLRFAREDDAANAAARLVEFAFTTTTERGDSAGQWVLIATKTMHPVESDLVGLRQKLNVIATEEHGTYTGWRAAKASP